MESKLEALKLFLDALGVESDISTVDDRKRVQKAVYLGQRAGADLGYRFNWYVMGPYSPSLTRDYYQLAEELENEGASIDGKALWREHVNRLTAIQDSFRPPSNVDLDQADWLELLASYDYLRTVSGYTHEKAAELLRKEKSHVSGFVKNARSVLQTVGLLT